MARSIRRKGGFRLPHFSSLPPETLRRDPQLVQLLLEVLAVQAELAGGLRDVAAVLAQGFYKNGALETLDELALGGLEIVLRVPGQEIALPGRGGGGAHL